MRRIVSTIGPALVLVVSVVPSAAHSSVPRARDARTHHLAAHHSARSTTGLDTASTALGAAYVHVSWNWIKAASGYRVQIAKRQDFASVVVSKKKANSHHRPAGGREATVVGRLKDATYYWVRVRKVKGHHHSGWSDPVRVATKAHVPDKITSARGVPGAQPGTTTLRWKGSGKYTDHYRVTTALTPFGSAQSPGPGRDSTTFTVPGNRHSYTMSPAQTAAAGAGVGTGHFLFFRITAVRSGNADTATRSDPHLSEARVKGEHSTGNGHELRFATYNVHVASKDVPGHPWKQRQKLIARTIKKVRPDVMGLSEMMAVMWDKRAGGKGLHASLRKVGLGQYKLTRTTPYTTNGGGDARILYNPRKVTMVGNCPENTPSCYINLPDPTHPNQAAYALFKDKASGQEFYFVSTHLSANNDAQTDALRARQAQAIVDGMASVNRENLPVVIGGDTNSSQTSAGSDGPHMVFVNAGYYNTQSAARVVNDQYNSVNHYETPERPSNYGIGSMYDSVMTLHMPGADLWKQMHTGAPWPSDHNMVFTDVRLP